MKKTFAFVLILALLLPLSSLASDSADIDLSGLSFDELIALRDRLNLAIWNSQEWQEVTVPIGAWKIGEDIPVGKWTIRMADDATSSWGSFVYCDRLDATGSVASSDGKVWQWYQLNPKDSSDNELPVSVDLDCHEKMFIVIERSPLVFTPYAGKPDLGFH